MASPAPTNYRGIFLLGEKSDTPVDVECEDLDGKRFVIPIPEYESRFVQPPWQELPWQYEHTGKREQG